MSKISPCFAYFFALAVPISLAQASCSASYDVSARTSGDAIKEIPQRPHKAVCPPVQGQAHCMARARVDASGQVQPFAAPTGLTPKDLASAYDIPTSGGAGMTIGIVDAYDNPNAEQDLATYRRQFGLPPCTAQNGCFTKVNQAGKASPAPPPDPGWAAEIALDLDMASAACPACKIVLVEANTASLNDLGTAVNAAVSLGANVVSNSYGATEDNSIVKADELYFNHPGVTILASAGDSGYGVMYPASSRYVLAVGGTSLAATAASPRGWVEAVWGGTAMFGTGSGCSKYSAKPSFQTDGACAQRTVADVSAVADPNTGVAVYNTYGGSGWAVYGGTSASSPLVAAILAVTGKASVGNSWPYAHADAFYDVTSGSNGECGGSYLCTGIAGYDGPTGVGTPNGQAILSGPGGGGGGGNDGGARDPCAGHDPMTVYYALGGPGGSGLCVASTYYCNPKGPAGTQEPQVPPPTYDQSLGGGCAYNGWSMDPNQPLMWQENFCKACIGDCATACHPAGSFPVGK